MGSPLRDTASEEVLQEVLQQEDQLQARAASKVETRPKCCLIDSVNSNADPSSPCWLEADDYVPCRVVDQRGPTGRQSHGGQVERWSSKVHPDKGGCVSDARNFKMPGWQ